MPQAFGQAAANLAASYGANQFTQVVAYVAVAAITQYGINKVTASLTHDRPKGEGRGLEVAITDTGAAGFAIYGLVRVGGTNVIAPEES